MGSIQENIRNILNGNANIAFVIGNGINMHFFYKKIPLWGELINMLWVKYFGKSIKGANGISLTELYDLLEFRYCDEKETIQKRRNALKKDVISRLKNNLINDDLSYFINKIKTREAPILTTNFDTLLSSSVGLEMKKMGKSFTDFYPWNVYFSDCSLESPTVGFGIWHINGLVNYHRSIKLSLSDYMGCVARTRKMLHLENMNDYFNGKRQNYWRGYNTWLHIMFNKDLFIFGLALEENEVFLRWLLIQRAKYSKMYNLNLKGWFVDKDINEGKKFFLQTLGFDVIELTNYDDLYNSFQ